MKPYVICHMCASVDGRTLPGVNYPPTIPDHPSQLGRFCHGHAVLSFVP